MARILLVENNEFVRDVLRSEMEAAGHRVDCVGRRAEAATALGQAAYDLLVCDTWLPDGSCHDLVMRAGKSGVGAMVISGDRGELADLAAAPWVTSLRKPFKLADLRQALALALDAAHPAAAGMAVADLPGRSPASASPGR